MQDVVIVGIVFTAVVMIVKYSLDHALKMKLIEKGQIADVGKGIELHFTTSAESSLKWGIVLSCVGAVLFVMEWVPTVFKEEVVLGALLITAGVALLAHYAIADLRARRLKHSQPPTL